MRKVLPPSVLYSHSYADRFAAGGASSAAVPETFPGLAAKMRGPRVADFLTANPALAMIEAPFSTFASTMFWT